MSADSLSLYRAPAWLPGAHLQTIWPAIKSQGPALTYRRERWTTPDDDFIDLDFLAPDAPPRAVLVLFHGLEGSSRSQYATSIMKGARRAGWLGAVAHFRGCSGELNRAPRAYHSGDSLEIGWVLQKMAERFATLPRYAAGVSLGANALLKWVGEAGESASRSVSACAAISAPQDLHVGAVGLSKGINRIYTRHFLTSLKIKSALKLDQYPGLFDRERMLRADDLCAFDDAVTAPMHGFTSCIDYWQRSSCKQFLAGVRIPSLVVNARNDPFLPGASLATVGQVSSSVRLDYSAHGGHAGFMTGAPLGNNDWLGERVVRWFGQGD